MSISGETDDAQRDEALLWLPIAEEDLAGARLALSADPPPLGVATYHCQQTIEKLLKAPLVLAGRPVRKIHGLDLLAAEAEEAWPGLRELVGDAALATRLGFAYRYPHAGPAFAVRPTPERVSSVITDAERLHAFLTERLARA